MRRIDPLFLGVAKTLAVTALVPIVLALGFSYDSPNPNLMYAIAQVGIAIVFAYVVVAVWMVERFGREDGDDHRDWLGTSCGFGVAGLTGVAAALFVGAHRQAGYANFLDAVGLWWSVVSLLMLGAIVVVQPLLADMHRANVEGSARPKASPDPRPGAW